MKIGKLEIKGFGKFKDRQFQLSDGLNVIYGSNEAGKTTLQLFIKAMFYGLKGGRASKEGLPAQLNRLRPWSANSYAGVMEYSLGNGQRFRVERDFDKGTAVIYDSSFNDISGSFPAMRDKQPLFAEMHMGMPEDCFEKTIFIKQLETRLDGEGSGGLLVRLANISQTGYEDVSLKNAENALKEAIKKNLGTGRTTTQPADLLEARLKELNIERLQAVKKKEVSCGNSNMLTQLRNEKVLKQKEQAFLKDTGELIRQRKKLDERKKIAKELRTVLAELKEIQAEITAADLELRALSEGALSGGMTRVSRTRSRKRKWWVLIYTAIALMIAGGAAVFTDRLQYLGLQQIQPQYRYYIAPVAVLIIAVVIFRVISKIGSLKIGNLPVGTEENTERQMHRGTEECGNSLEKLAALNDRIKDMYSVAALSCGKVLDGVPAVEAEYAAAQREAFGMERTLEKDIDTVVANYADYALGVDFFDTDSLRQTLTEADTKWLEESWEYSIEAVDSNLSQSSLDIREYETLSRDSSDDGDELQRIDEEIAALLEKKKMFDEKGAALSIALENLQAAAADIRKSFSPALDIKMSGIISSMTGERYSELKADDGLRLMTVTPENGEVKNAALLSGGTADQLYLALRIAAADILEPEGEKLPIIMDEVFSQYDDERIRRTMVYLKEMCIDRQVIVLTCKKRELELAEEISGGGITIHILE